VTLPRILVYSRPGCHLCDELLEALLPLVRDQATVEVRNVDDHPAWQARYSDRVPVVELDGKPVCQHHLDAVALGQALAAATPPVAAS